MKGRVMLNRRRKNEELHCSNSGRRLTLTVQLIAVRRIFSFLFLPPQTGLKGVSAFSFTPSISTLDLVVSVYQCFLIISNSWARTEHSIDHHRTIFDVSSKENNRQTP